jgi:hypothetical protein
MARSNGPWIYGSHGPTALDTHFAIFLKRMKEVGHGDFLSETTTRYLTDAERTDELKNTMQGRDTLPAAFIKAA